MESATWKDFDLTLDDLNEVVNFHFEVSRPSENCEACDRSGYNPETRQLSASFYSWKDFLTEDEIAALVQEGRLLDLTHVWDGVKWAEKSPGVLPTRAEVRAWDRKPPGIGHDAINRFIATKCRATRMGVYGLCLDCNGKGYKLLGPAQLSLILWVIHPRKGASRGCEIKGILQEDLPAVYKFLRSAAERNQQRFAKIP